MTAKRYTVTEVARGAGVSVRTLHYYDELALLRPKGRSQAGYRLYGDRELERLQQILLWRRLGLGLEQIRKILDDPSFDRRLALMEQRRHLREEARLTNQMLHAIDRAIQSLERGTTMNMKQMFEGFEPADYETEVKERWGETHAYSISAKRTKSYTPKDWQNIRAELDEILTELSRCMADNVEPMDKLATELADRHRLHIDRWFYPCSPDMHQKLAEMYVGDERFVATFERHGAGLGEYLAKAIQANQAPS